MSKLSFFFAIFFICKFLAAQKIETVYLSPKDSTSNMYIVVFPSKLPYKGYTFLIPGMFQKAKDVLVQTNLPLLAAQEGLLVIIPTFKTGIASFGFDSATQSSFREMLEHVTSAYKLKGLNFYLGGFSIGGTCAIKYAELSLAGNNSIQPSAVFAIDAPLDFERMYKNILRETRLPNSTEDALAESRYILKRCQQEFGGSPQDNLSSYHKKSPYSFTDTTQHAIRPLVKIPIRFYTEPDIHWWLDEGVDYSMMNAFDFAAMTNELRRMGNKRVELITTKAKGYRIPGNKRHPHSWSIAEPKGLVKWLLAQN